MAIVVNQAPAEVSFSRNPIVYELQANDIVEVSGVASVTAVTFASAITAGVVISLRFNGLEVRFVAATVPNASGNEFPLSATPDGTYVASLIPFFQNNFYIDQYYTVTSGTNGGHPALIFTAKKTGLAYAIRTGTYQSGSIVQVTAAVDEVRKANFAIYVEVNLLDDAGALTKIYGQPYETDEAGIAKVDISKILHAHLDADLPPTNGDKVQRCVKSNRKYALRVAEASGNPFNIGILTQLASKRVVMGGVPYESGPGQTPVTVTQGAAVTDDIALRIGPNELVTRVDQPQYLTFLLSRATGTETVRLVALLYFSDESSQTVTGITSIASQAVNNTVQFATGFADLNLSSYETSTKFVTRYTLQLTTNTGTVRSRVYTYNVERDFKPYSRYFVYVNSLGALDTIDTYGKGSETWAFSKQSAEKYLAQNYKLTDGTTTDFDLSADVKFEVASGWLQNKGEVRRFADLFLSRWKFRRINSQYLPITVNTKEVKMAPDGDGRHVVSFEYQYQFDHNLLSNETLDGEWFDLLPPPFAGGGIDTTWAWIKECETNPDVPDWVLNITQQDIANWNTAFSWGNHESAGYLLAADAALEYATNERVDGIETRVEVLETTVNDLVTESTSLNELDYVGGEDEEGYVNVPLLGITKSGRVGDWANIKPNIWIRIGRELQAGENLYKLYASSGLDDAGEEQPSKPSQSGFDFYYCYDVPSLINAPAGFLGTGYILVFTVVRYCRVEIRGYSGQTLYSENFNPVNPAVPWSPWKPVMWADESLNIGSILKATGIQSVGNTKAIEDVFGNWRIGSESILGSAMFTVGGRLSIAPALYNENAVRLDQLREMLFGKVDVTLFDKTVLELYEAIYNAADTGNHTHEISQIIDLFEQLQSKVPKSITQDATSNEYDAITALNGQLIMKSVKNPKIRRTRLPDAKEGEEYNFTLPPSDFVWPTKTNTKNASAATSEDWLRASEYSLDGGMHFSGTPPNKEAVTVIITMDTDVQTIQWTLLLSVIPATTTVTAPAAPSGLVLSNIIQTGMKSAWNDNSGNEAGFEIQTSLTNVDADFRTAQTTGLNATSFNLLGLNPNTKYYVRVRAVNSVGASEWITSEATTPAVETGGNLFEEYPTEMRLYDFAAVVTPPIDPPVDPNTQIPNYADNIRRINWQTLRSLEYDAFRWSDGKVYQFGQAPANLTVVAGDVRKDGGDTWDEVIDHVRQQVLKYKTPIPLAVVMTWGDFQFSATNIDLRPFKYIQDKCFAKGVKLAVYFNPCFDKNIVTGIWDSSRDGWAYRESDLMMVKDTNGEVKSAHGGGFSMSSDYAKNNALNTFQALINFAASQTSKSAVQDWGWCITAEKESHGPIPAPNALQSVCDFNPASIESFKEWLLVNYGNSTAYGNVNTISAGSIQPFFSDNGTDQQKYILWLTFMTSKIWSFHGKWMSIASKLGYGTIMDFGSFIDANNPRLHKFFLGYNDGYNAFCTTMKHNPELRRGIRDGSGNYSGEGNAWYEAAVLVGSGKYATVEWTFDPPSLHDFLGNDMNAIRSTYTRIYKETFDAGARTISAAFVGDIASFNTYLVPVLDNLKADGYLGKPMSVPKAVPAGVTTVRISSVVKVGSHYAGGWANDFRDKVLANGIANCEVRIVSDQFLP